MKLFFSTRSPQQLNLQTSNCKDIQYFCKMSTHGFRQHLTGWGRTAVSSRLAWRCIVKACLEKLTWMNVESKVLWVGWCPNHSTRASAGPQEAATPGSIAPCLASVGEITETSSDRVKGIPRGTPTCSEMKGRGIGEKGWPGEGWPGEVWGMWVRKQTKWLHSLPSPDSLGYTGPGETVQWLRAFVVHAEDTGSIPSIWLESTHNSSSREPNIWLHACDTVIHAHKISKVVKYFKKKNKISAYLFNKVSSTTPK